MRSERSVDEILLVRELDVSFDKRVVRILWDLAQITSLAWEMIGSRTEYEQCLRCPNNPANVSRGLVGCLLSGRQVEVIESSSTSGDPRCRECAGRSNRAIETIRAELRKMERRVAREAFLVVSDD